MFTIAMAGVDMRLEAGAIRELHWHQSAEVSAFCENFGRKCIDNRRKVGVRHQGATRSVALPQMMETVGLVEFNKAVMRSGGAVSVCGLDSRTTSRIFSSFLYGPQCGYDALSTRFGRKVPYSHC